MKKHNNSGKKSEPTSKRAKTRGPMRRDTKEVLAELVGKLKEKLDPKKVAATSGGEERERGELRLCLANWYGESILPVIALRKWTESYFWDGTGGSETIGAAKHAAMEKLRMIAWKFCRG